MNLTRHFFTVFAFFILSFQLQAEPQSLDIWQKIYDKVAREGHYVDRGEISFFVLEDTVPDNKDLNHTSNYLSGAGSRGDDGYAAFNSYHAVSEIWTIDANEDWRVDQWIFIVDLDGRRLQGNHYELRMKKSGTVIDDINLGASDTETEAKWQEVKAFWESKVK